MPDYVPFKVNQLLAGLRAAMPRMPYLKDEASKIEDDLPIEEMVFIIPTRHPGTDVVIFTSCDRKTERTREVGRDRVRVCFRRKSASDAGGRWSRIQHFNRTAGTIESVARKVASSMDGNASRDWGSLREALAIDHEPEIATPQRPPVRPPPTLAVPSVPRAAPPPPTTPTKPGPADPQPMPAQERSPTLLRRLRSWLRLS